MEPSREKFAVIWTRYINIKKIKAMLCLQAITVQIEQQFRGFLPGLHKNWSDSRKECSFPPHTPRSKSCWRGSGDDGEDIAYLATDPFSTIF